MLNNLAGLLGIKMGHTDQNHKDHYPARHYLLKEKMKLYMWRRHFAERDSPDGVYSQEEDSR